jgi:DmsE family decaheme c-type cytochrome
MRTSSIGCLVFFSLMATCGTGWAQSPDTETAVVTDTEPKAASFSRKGADTCLRCHDEDSDFPVLDLFKTRHGQQADTRSPFAQHQCESCHGASGEHSKRPRKAMSMRNFGVNSKASAEDENQVCIGCHQQGATSDWHTSTHQENDIKCANCHTIHTTNDKVLDKQTQPSVCFDCHQKQRADSMKASTHPVRYGKMACSDCHQPHDSKSEHSLIGNSINETCYTCHAEKRGPFLWEHAPASEDCSLCHESHGSNHPSLLIRRSPLLCQSCHSRSGHPELAYGGDQLPGQDGLRSAFLLSQGCANCHSQVHGSNHPSGLNLAR